MIIIVFLIEMFTVYLLCYNWFEIHKRQRDRPQGHLSSTSVTSSILSMLRGSGQEQGHGKEQAQNTAADWSISRRLSNNKSAVTPIAAAISSCIVPSIHTY